VDGDAVAGEDYEATSGHLVFSGEVTEQTVPVSIWGDESIEGDESLFVELLAAEGAIVVRPHGEVVIIDDDAAPVPPSLEIATQGSGLVTLEPPGGVYPEGTQVQLTAAAAPGHAFAGWEGDLVGTANPATLLMDRDHQVLARFEAQEPTLLQVESGTAGSAGFVSTTAPLAAVDGDLYLAAIAFKPDVAVTSVSGLGLAWTPVRTQCSGRDQTGLSVWQARGEPTAGGVVTATFSQSPENSVLAVSRYGGVGAVDPERAVSANSVGIAGACSGGSDGVAYSLDLDTATSNSLVYVAAAPRNRDHLPGPGFIERAEIFSGGTGSTAGVSVADTQAGPPGPVAIVGGFSGDTDWAVVAFEIPLAAPFHLAVEPSTGGSVGVDPPYETFVDGAPVTLWALPEEGYRFIGWSGDLSGAQSPTTLVMDSDKTVGATFAPQFRVELSVANGGSVTLDPPGGQYDEGSIVTLTALPQDGHFFVGWSGDLSGAQNPAALLMDSDRSVGAIFSARFTVDALASSGGSVTLDPPGGIYDEGSVVTLHAAPDPDHRFAGWGGALTGLQNPASLLVESDSIVTAGFVRVFDVSVSPGPGGTITLDPPSGPYDDGSSLTFTAVPDASHRFGGWSGALSGRANPAVLVIEADESVAATFVPQFTLSLTPPVGGYVTINPPGSRHDVGTAVTLTAFPEEAYSFTGWSGDLGGAQNPTTMVMDSDKSVGASFVPYFLVDVATTFGGSVALDPPGGLYAPGATVTLTATAEPGLAFGGWDGALSGAANPASLVVDRDLAVGAWFVTPVTLQQVESGASGSSTSVSTDGALTAVEDDLYVASIAVRPDLAVSGVSGLGLTWSPLGSQCGGRGQTGVAVWAARGQPVADGVVTASFSAAPQNSVLAVSRYTSAGLLDPARVASANSLGVAGPCAGGEDQDAYALPLDASTRGSLAVVATAIRNRDHLPGSGYEERIERHKGSGGSVAGLALAERRIDAPGSTAVLGGFSSVVDWAAVAVEVPGAPVPVPEPSEPLMFTSALALLLGLGRSRITRPAASGVVSQSEPIEQP